MSVLRVRLKEMMMNETPRNGGRRNYGVGAGAAGGGMRNLYHNPSVPGPIPLIGIIVIISICHSFFLFIAAIYPCIRNNQRQRRGLQSQLR